MLKNAHLRRQDGNFETQHTTQYASPQNYRPSLHLGIFEHQLKAIFMNSIVIMLNLPASLASLTHNKLEGFYCQQRGSWRRPKVLATPACVTLPSAIFNPFASARSSFTALLHPRLASFIMYGKVALARAMVDVCGNAPGILATQ